MQTKYHYILNHIRYAQDSDQSYGFLGIRDITAIRAIRIINGSLASVDRRITVSPLFIAGIAQW